MKKIMTLLLCAATFAGVSWARPATGHAKDAGAIQAEDPLYIVGQADNLAWDVAEPAVFNYVDGKYVFEAENLSMFKLSTQYGDWDIFDEYALSCPEGYGDTPGVAVPLTVGSDINIFCPWTGDYTIEVAGDLSTITLYTDSKPSEYLDVYLRGDMNAWDFSEEWKFTRLNDDLYKFTCSADQFIQNSESFKIADAGWAKVNYGVMEMGDVLNLDATNALFYNGKNIILSEDWNGVAYFKLSTGEFFVSNDKEAVPDFAEGQDPQDPTDPVIPEQEVVIYENDFSENLNNWEIINDETLSDFMGWKINMNPPCAVCNSYYGGENHPADSKMQYWLDLAEYENCRFSFEQGFGYDFPQTQTENYRVYILEEDSETPNYLTMANFPPVPESGNWSKEWALNMFDISEYDGKRIAIGFEYFNDGEASHVWELRNFKVIGTGKAVEPQIPEFTEGDALYITGNGEGIPYWDPAEPAQFNYADGKYTLTVNGLHSFKMSYTKGTWQEFNVGARACFYGETPGVTVALDNADNDIIVPWPGDYTIEVAGDLSTLTLYTDTPAPEPTAPEENPSDLYMYSYYSLVSSESGTQMDSVEVEIDGTTAVIRGIFYDYPIYGVYDEITGNITVYPQDIAMSTYYDEMMKLYIEHNYDDEGNYVAQNFLNKMVLYYLPDGIELEDGSVICKGGWAADPFDQFTVSMDSIVEQNFGWMFKAMNRFMPVGEVYPEAPVFKYVESEWEDFGTALLTERWFSIAFEDDMAPYDVQVKRNVNNPKELLLVNPYGDYTPMGKYNTAADKTGYIYLNVENPDCILVRPMVVSGFENDALGNVKMLATTVEGFDYYVNGLSREDIMFWQSDVATMSDNYLVRLPYCGFQYGISLNQFSYWQDSDGNPIFGCTMIQLPTLSDDPVRETCAVPVINIVDNRLVATCKTEGAKVYTSIVAEDQQSVSADGEVSIDLTGVYKITAYATCSGMYPSDEVKATLVWTNIESFESDVDIAMERERAILIRTVGENIELVGTLEGEPVELYSLGGAKIYGGKALEGVTRIPAALQGGEVYIVIVGQQHVKYKL